VKTKIFMSMLVIALAAALVGGATMAWFTDEATNVGNTFTAGTVDIVAHRGMGDPSLGPMFYTTFAEGTVPPGGHRFIAPACGGLAVQCPAS